MHVMIAQVPSVPSRQAGGVAGKTGMRNATTWLAAGTILAILITILTVLLMRHARHHVVATPGRGTGKRKGRRSIDAWAESARRTGTPPAGWQREGGSGSDDDTVDIDPNELGSDDLGPGDVNSPKS